MIMGALLNSNSRKSVQYLPESWLWELFSTVMLAFKSLACEMIYNSTFWDINAELLFTSCQNLSCHMMMLGKASWQACLVVGHDIICRCHKYWRLTSRRISKSGFCSALWCCIMPTCSTIKHNGTLDYIETVQVQ